MTLIVLLLAMAAGNVFGQAMLVQDKNKVNNVSPDEWVFFSPGEAEQLSNINFPDINLADTIITELYRTYPYMDFVIEIADTNSATDSVAVKFELWQNDEMDTTNAFYVKDLVLSNDDGTLTEQASATTVGKWFVYVGETPFLDVPYFFLRIVPQTGSRVVNPGVSIKITGFGNYIRVTY